MEPPRPPSRWDRMLPALNRGRSLTTRVGTRAWRQAPTLRGQASGAAMMITPAVAHALPLDGGARTAVQVVAVLVGSAGALIVFGGLLTRAVLAPVSLKAAQNSGRSAVTAVSAGRVTPVATTRTVDDALLGLPHAHTAWAALVLLTVALAASALWCLGRLFTGHGSEWLPEFLLLGLPALALGWAAWRGRVMWSGQTDQPD